MKKHMGLAGIFCISAGAMISSGLFVLPGLAFAKAGPGVFLSYFLAGLAALTTVLSLSELITAMPKAGGDYFYVSRTFGQLYGTVSGVLSWLALSFKSAFAIFGIAELLYLTFGLPQRPAAVAMAAVFTALNLLGVKEAVRFQVALVALLIGILILFFAIGLGDMVTARFRPFLGENGLNGILSTAGFVFVAFGGVLTTASIAGEIDNPARNIPLGLIGSTVVVTILYTLVTFVVVGIVEAEELSQSLAPLALAADRSGGKLLYGAVMLASLLAFVTTANGGILTASRYPIALAKDRMIPTLFARSSRVKATPYPAIIATGTLIALSVLLKLDLLIKSASTVILLSNIFAHLSVIVMRESGIKNYLPTYRAPLYPWLQIVGIVVFILLIIDMGVQPILLSLGFCIIGVLLYFTRRQNSHSPSSALLLMLQRIINKAMITADLQNELRDIVVERDRITPDDFDRAIEQSIAIDLAARPHLDEVWKAAAEAVCAKLSSGLGVDEYIELFKQREAEGSTALSDFLAVPHIIVDGPEVFEVILVRVREGIAFDADSDGIKAMVFLIGSRDVRHLHLQALAAIAQVAQQEDFEAQWLAAESPEELRDIFLLSQRMRKTDDGARE
jgi:basic amino acid/polyamine antiporter, APA family